MTIKPAKNWITGGSQGSGKQAPSEIKQDWRTFVAHQSAGVPSGSLAFPFEGSAKPAAQSECHAVADYTAEIK